MSITIDQSQFSPLFGVRKKLLILRWLLGFPLKPVNMAFNQFAFHPWLEYISFSIYVSIPHICTGYQNFVHAKYQDVENPFLAFVKPLSATGLSALDLVIMVSMPFVNQIWATLYLVSFKKNAKDISKVCLYGTNINKELHSELAKINLIVNPSNHKKSTTLFVVGCIIVTIASASGAIFWLLIVSKYDRILDAEIIAFCISSVIFNFCSNYPSIAVSADLLVCHLLCEVGHSFEKWRAIMKPMKYSAGQKKYNELEDESSNRQHTTSSIRYGI